MGAKSGKDSPRRTQRLVQAMKRRFVDEKQQAMDFEAQLEVICDAVGAIADRCEETRTEQRERSRAEFYVEQAAACKRAIQKSGMSRAQIVDRINENWRPIEEECGIDGAKTEGRSRAERGINPPLLSLCMLNNYLSKPTENRLPAWLIYAICEVTECLEPLAVQIENLGGTIIDRDERDELTLGKLEATLKAARVLKTQMIRQYGSVRG